MDQSGPDGPGMDHAQLAKGGAGHQEFKQPPTVCNRASRKRGGRSSKTLAVAEAMKNGTIV